MPPPPPPQPAQELRRPSIPPAPQEARLSVGKTKDEQTQEFIGILQIGVEVLKHGESGIYTSPTGPRFRPDGSFVLYDDGGL